MEDYKNLPLVNSGELLILATKLNTLYNRHKQLEISIDIFLDKDKYLEDIKVVESDVEELIVEIKDCLKFI